MKKEVVLSHQLVRQLRIVENASNINVEGEMKNIISLNDEEKMILVEVGKGKTNRKLAEILNFSQRGRDKLTHTFISYKFHQEWKQYTRRKNYGSLQL